MLLKLLLLKRFGVEQAEEPSEDKIQRYQLQLGFSSPSFKVSLVWVGRHLARAPRKSWSARLSVCLRARTWPGSVLWRCAGCVGKRKGASLSWELAPCPFPPGSLRLPGHSHTFLCQLYLTLSTSPESRIPWFSLLLKSDFQLVKI